MSPAEYIIGEREICLNCTLPECKEDDEGCRLHHPESEAIEVQDYTVEQKKAIAKEGQERGIKLVAEERGIECTTIRAWVGAYCRGPKKLKDKLPNTDNMIKQDCKCNQPSTKPVLEANLIGLVEQTLEQEDIFKARIFWAGVKAGLTSLKGGDACDV